MENTQELIFCWETCTRWSEFHEKHNISASQDDGAPSFGAMASQSIMSELELASSLTYQPSFIYLSVFFPGLSFLLTITATFTV